MIMPDTMTSTYEYGGRVGRADVLSFISALVRAPRFEALLPADLHTVLRPRPSPRLAA